MAKNIKRHISHLKSSGTTLPSASDLVYGEIAVGYLKDNEALFIKNSNDEIVPFTSAAYEECYADRRAISSAVGDTEITVTLSDISDSVCSGRTLTVKHASGSTQSGFKKLASDSYGHITGGTAVTLSDLTGLGVLSGITGGSGVTVSAKANASQTVYATLSSYTKSTYAAATGDTSGREYAVRLDKNGVLSVNVPWTNDNSGYVPTGRTITTASGLTGGGNLNANLTIGHSNNVTPGTASGTSSSTLSHGGTFKIPTITYDGQGHVTATGQTELTLPGNDNYITSVEGISGISASVTSGKLTVKHTNSITAGSAKTSTTSATGISTGNTAVKIPSIAYDAHGHITNTAETTVNFSVAKATTAKYGAVMVATTTGTNNSDIVMTQSAVTKAIEDSFAAQDAMRYKGTLSSKTQFESLSNYKVGDTYKVATAFTTTSGVKLEIGDMVIAEKDDASFNVSDFNFIQANLDPTQYVLTSRTVTTASGLTGGGDLSSNRTIGLEATTVSAGTYGPSANVTGSNNTTILVPQITVDAYGRVTSLSSRTYTSVDHTYTVNNGTFTISGDGTSVASTSANANTNSGLNIKPGTNVAVTTGTNEITISATDTNYYTSGLTVTTATTSNTITVKGTNSGVTGTAVLSAATTSAAGLMASADKTALNNLNPLSGKVSTLSAITATSTAINSLTGSVGTMAFQNTSSYSSATQVNTALGNKQDKATSGTAAQLSAGTDTTQRVWTAKELKNGIVALGYEANQNAYSNIKIGSTTLAAASTTDTVEFAVTNTKGTDGLTISGTNGGVGADKVTINLGDIECGDYA